MKREDFPENIAVLSHGRFFTAICTACGQSLGTSGSLDTLRVTASVHNCERREKLKQEINPPA